MQELTNHKNTTPSSLAVSKPISAAENAANESDPNNKQDPIIPSVTSPRVSSNTNAAQMKNMPMTSRVEDKSQYKFETSKCRTYSIKTGMAAKVSTSSPPDSLHPKEMKEKADHFCFYNLGNQNSS